MTTAEHPTQSVRVHETEHLIQVDIDLPEEGQPQLLVCLTPRGLQLRVFRPLEPVLPWHSNPNATPI
jgi:hypothetical protein